MRTFEGCHSSGLSVLPLAAEVGFLYNQTGEWRRVAVDVDEKSKMKSMLQAWSFRPEHVLALAVKAVGLVWSSASDSKNDRADIVYEPDYSGQLSNDPCRLAMLSVLEEQIIPRLVLAHPLVANPLTTADVARRAPTIAEVRQLAQMCLSDDRGGVAALIAALQEEGLPLEAIFVDLVAPAARLLGTMWDDDQIGFDQVTMGLVFMHEIVHGMGYEYQDGPQQAGAVQRVMLACAPGSQHVLGLSIVSEFFRKGGWQVVMEISPSARELRHAVQNEWFDLIGLSIALEAQLADLPALVVSLKKASRNPKVRVLLGGRVFHDQRLDPRDFGAEGICTDAKEATAVAAAVVVA